MTLIQEQVNLLNKTVADQNQLILQQGALIERLNNEVTQLKSQGIPNSMDPEINNRVETLEELSKLRLAPTCEHLCPSSTKTI